MDAIPDPSPNRSIKFSSTDSLGVFPAQEENLSYFLKVAPLLCKEQEDPELHPDAWNMAELGGF